MTIPTNELVKLPITVGSRVRLTPNQRQTLKDAFIAQREDARDAGNGLRVSSATQTKVEQSLGCSSIVITDLLNTRDTLALGVVLQLQNALDVEVVTKKDVMAACKSYTDFIFDKYSK